RSRRRDPESRRPYAVQCLAARLHQGDALPGHRGPSLQSRHPRRMAPPLDDFRGCQRNGTRAGLALLYGGAAHAGGNGAGEEAIMSRKINRQDMREAAEKYKNWGRWGAKDEIG